MYILLFLNHTSKRAVLIITSVPAFQSKFFVHRLHVSFIFPSSGSAHVKHENNTQRNHGLDKLKFKQVNTRFSQG